MWPVVVAAALLFAQASDHAVEGMQALDEGRYEQAAESFRKVLEADPEDYGAHFHLALIDSIRGNRDQAIAGYRKVLELKPGLYEAELNLGILLLGGGKAAEAVTLLGSAVESKPEEYRPNLYLAEGLLETGVPARAETYFRKAVALKEDDALARVGLARAILRQGRLDDAAPVFEQAAEIDPSHRDALLELAAAYEAARRPAEAIALYREFPGDPAVAERLGGLLLESDNAAQAAEALRFAVEQSPTAANRYALAVAAIRLEQPDEAAKQLELALAAEPENFDLRLTYGRVLRDLRRFAAASQEFLHASRLRRDSLETWNELAGALLLAEDYPRAMAALDEAEKLGGPTAPIFYMRAIMCDKVRQYEPAQAAYEQFLALSDGASPDEEFKARQRLIVIRKELSR